MADASQPAGLATSWRLWWQFELQRTTGGGPVARLSQIVRRRAVLGELILRGLKVKYSESVLGYAWSFVEPLLLVAVYWVVFGRVARLNLPHYPLFIAAALMPWFFFNGGLSQSTGSITNNKGIIRTINLPREIYPIAAVGEQLIEYLLSLPVVFLVGFLYGVVPSAWVAWLPVAAAVQTVLVAGCALLLSGLNAIFRDVSRILRVVLRVMFYLSPVVYPSGRIHGVGATLYKLNPMVGILELNRAVWYPGQVPTGTLYQHLIYSTVGAVLLLVIGWWVFISLERPMLKEL